MKYIITGEEGTGKTSLAKLMTDKTNNLWVYSDGFLKLKGVNSGLETIVIEEVGKKDLNAVLNHIYHSEDSINYIVITKHMSSIIEHAVINLNFRHIHLRGPFF